MQIRKDGVHGLFAADGRENLLEGDAVFSSHVAQGADKAFNRFRVSAAKIGEGVLEAAELPCVLRVFQEAEQFIDIFRFGKNFQRLDGGFAHV